MAAFSNNHGGYIIFGVTNAPRRLVGIKKEVFDDFDTAKFSTALNDIFDPAILWDVGMIESDGLHFGYIYSYRQINRPVICRKSASKDLRPGEIYYRYHGQTKVIAFPELRALLDEVRETERRLWMKHVESIARIGPANLAFLDMTRGGISALGQPPQLIIDHQLLQEMRKQFVFIEEGRFSEKDGAPTLQLKGTLIASDTLVSPALEPEKNYPYIMSEVASKVGISKYETQVLIWHFELKKDPRYAAPVKFGTQAHTTKYSEATIRLLNEKLGEQVDRSNFLEQIKILYANRNRQLN